MLFDSGADISFVSTTFSTLLDVIPFTLDVSYAVELANGRISKTNVILTGYTLGLLGHPFDIDLICVELGSFDVTVDMDWLAKYYAVIVFDENIVRIPCGDEVLIIEGDGCDGGSKTKLSIISCPEIIHETTEKIVQIKSHIQAARDHQKSYTDEKPNPRYIGPFKILSKVRTVAYRLGLPEQLRRVHSMFHISNLKKCLSDETLAILSHEVQIDDKLHFIEEPVEIMDWEVKHLKQSRILIVKVRWNSKRGPEFTWEREDQMKKKYPHLFTDSAPMADVTF
uniref:Putative reverse transcriptase domain-containing protein n=1 Tax=Tanacetum cinerariifolium TaxID=118510 RepID=A0A699I5B2_TANCI|nr:putative reverse transcriptase domain-containing protein [Tanacetum cinerariifolium]